jgi:hypothetical protein
VDLEKMRADDREARKRKLYGHSSTAKEREREADPKASPESAMAIRHADEIGELQTRQHAESQAVYQKHNQARATRLQTSQSMPGTLEQDQAEELEELHARHRRERGKLEEQQLIERAGLRQKAARR